jgi:hypothetical protein
LDFRRNQIIDEEPGGLVNPWAHVPDKVRYVLWQHDAFKNFGDLGVRTTNDYTELINGPGKQDRTIGVRAFAFHNHLQELFAASTVITTNDEFAVFKLEGPYK